MIKKLLTLFVATTMVISISGCGSDNTESSSGTVRIICPYGVGGTADLIARKYALVAGELFPEKNFIVENMTGGDGFAAATYYTELDPDTTDLLIYGYGVIYRHDLGKEYGTEIVDFDRDEIQPIGIIDDRTWILYSTPGTTVEDVLAKAKNGGIKMSGGNPLSDPHLALGSLIAEEQGKTMVIPYDGGASQKKALTDGEVDVFVGTTQAGKEEVEAGTMEAILSFSIEEFEGFVGPDGKAVEIPTVAGENKHEALRDDVDYSQYILPSGGFIATRAGAPAEWVAEMEEITKAVWNSPEYYEWIEEIMLNKKELYGADAVAYVEEASLIAKGAFETLR
ncbi:tripartite tricarboxylate transporter substrate-binding protein [Candidatus Epulonipiscium viviparus]|uniref:tripartite tricarboxylate transporter substrate-binding protein n=1 Tax=Candidatus Epulonipiscium viviparus TaxID=420336 RepID=UPI0027380E95|nr:tripartite tricarboxylate transporter substrate-binding protein [Candidatus Epulopiscium viviparus]